MTPLIPADLACPLCGDQALCGMSLGLKDCWCFEQDFPQELLALVPDPQIGVACICQPCVRASQVILAAGERLTIDSLLKQRSKGPS